jgi:DNA (cytosine-5)-methyltransferase 1
MERTTAMMIKPPYRVPSMTEIAAIPWNGFTAASTFSGCGGSSLGYRMAGFRVLYANEFIPAAQDSYRANAADYTFLDTRDIRTVQPHDILEKIGLAPGELDLLDGSPPCASFSTAGKREAGWGKVKKYSDSEQRTDDLFFEFARLLRGLQPKTFVAENVSGLVKGTAKGYFLEILRELKSCGYKVGCKVLNARWLGVPQARQRTIFVGVRNDLHAEPAHPKPLPFCYSIQDALPWIVELKGGNKAAFSAKGKEYSTKAPCPTVMGGDTLGCAPYQFIVEAETDITRYAIGAEWERMSKPGTQSQKYFQLQRPSLDEPCPTITLGAAALSCAGVVHPTEKRRFSIAELKRICAFPDDFKLTGTYAQQWERCGRSVPPVMMSHIAATIRDEILRKL